MHKLLRKTILGFLLVTFLGVSANAQSRIATVDLRKIFDGYWKTKQADAALKDRAADMEKEHKNMLDDWKKSKEDYQTLLSSANDQAVSSDQRDKRKKLAEDKLKQIKESEDNIGQYERTAKQTLDDQRKRMRDNILGEIRTALNAKAKSAVYSLVIDTAAESINNTPIVLYTNNENDMTDDILKQLNVGAPAETPRDDVKPVENTNEKKKGGRK
jgi:outer membrane protein